MKLDWRDPRSVQRSVRWAVLLLGALLITWGLSGLRFTTIALEDDSTPEVAPGAKALVRTLADDDFTLHRGALYLFDRTGEATEMGELRLARLVGLPGDAVRPRVEDAAAAAPGALIRFDIGDTSLVLPAEIVGRLPDEVPADHVLLFTDNSACRHLDSRYLGPLPIERLKVRVLGSLGGLPRS
ncbi:MAG: hypothetical protein FJ293_16275 [Planctomycetes bacterium]|nr:hypothetical protein [Planctomycetota bacterium]